jgi:L-alanine-DL-glutamate epimerase-like enolase superfamily enzyme
MALYDSCETSTVTLYVFLGGKKKPLETDLTIGIHSAEEMAEQAKDFVRRGVRIIKIKLGKNATDDIERVRMIREAVGKDITLRIDANQGWSFEDAKLALTELGKYNVEFCEQPMRRYNDHHLPALKKISPIAIMADESVFDHYDAERVIASNGCSSVNIKFSKSGGILEAIKINEVCEKIIFCMMGGMLESRVALTAFAHFATAKDNIKFYDMDTCLLHKTDPVTGGVKYNGIFVNS